MKNFRLNYLIVYPILFGALILPAVSNALDLTLEPRFQAGVMDYAFEQKSRQYANAAGNSTTNKGFKLVSVMPFVGGGVTLFANRVFFDFCCRGAGSYFRNLSGKNALENNLGRAGGWTHLVVILKLLYSFFW